MVGWLVGRSVGRSVGRARLERTIYGDRPCFSVTQCLFIFSFTPLLLSDASDLYNVPPTRNRPLKIAIPEKEDVDDIYDTPSSTPALPSANTPGSASLDHPLRASGQPTSALSSTPKKGGQGSVDLTTSSRLSLPASGSPRSEIQVPPRTSLPAFQSLDQVLQPTHDSTGNRLPEAVQEEEEEEEAPTYDLVPTPSPAGSRVQSTIVGSRAPSSLSSSDGSGDRGKLLLINNDDFVVIGKRVVGRRLIVLTVVVIVTA